MIDVEVEREMERSADEVWALLADFGNLCWVPGIEKVEVEGEGVGMVRHLTVPVFPPLAERLDFIDHDEKVLEYSIPAVEYISVKNYVARAQVIDRGPGRCLVRFRSRAEAEGATDEEASEKTQTFYGGMLGWIEEYLDRQ